MCSIVVATTLTATFIKFEEPSTLLFFLTLLNSANAGADVLVDALMVMQAKRDPINGSQELQSLSWFVRQVATFIMGFTGAYLVAQYGAYSLFLAQAISGFSILMLSLMMSSRVEIEGDFEAEAMNTDFSSTRIYLGRTFSQELKHNWFVVKNALKIKILRSIYLYYILVAVTFPFFWNFMYYF